MINYFNFKKWNTNEYLITNDLGQYAFVNAATLYGMCTDSELPDEIVDELEEKQFLLPDTTKKFIPQNLKYAYRNTKSYLLSATALHIFVLTNQCNAHCCYCQAQDKSSTKHGVMTKEIAQRAVNIALSSPEHFLSFEFQGGEPLLNFSIIQYIVEYAEKNKGRHEISYSLVSNLTLMTDEILGWLIAHRVSISTSLDGPKAVQEINRPLNNGESSYAAIIDGIKRIYKYNYGVGAIQTTTRTSLCYAKEIVDEYVKFGLNNVFIRPLTPLGYAKTQWNEIGYTPAEFKKFYRETLLYILKLARNGVNIREGHASIILPKILCGKGQNYMELRSPCGATCGQMAYYYDGRIFTCDEGRMLAEMGNSAFKLGDVFHSTYDTLLDSSVCKATIEASILETLPSCSDCVYQPYCGTCPVINLAECGNIMPMKVNSYKCQTYKGIFDTIFGLLHSADNETIEILKSWT